MNDLRSYIRSVPDFPKKGIVFRDITTLLLHSEAFTAVIDELVGRFKDLDIQKVAAIESRGFIFGGALAQRLKSGFVPVRKPKKLPWKTVRQEYELEYGSDALEIHLDAIAPGERVLIIDDLLATGGTAGAACHLVRQVGGTIVGLAFLIELSFLHGRDKLKGYEIHSLITYESE